MKKQVLVGMLSFALSGIACAESAANLQIKIAGKIHNTDYLCVSHVGCVNVNAGSKGHIFPMDEGKVEHVFLANSSNLRMYPQPLPNSCQVVVKSQQILTVSGQISKAANDNVYINHLSCSVRPAA